MPIRLLLIIIWVTLCVMASYFLFKISFDVEHLDDDIASLNYDITNERHIIKNLHTEWAYLTAPKRIEQLTQHLLPTFEQAPNDHIISLDTIPKL